MDINRILEQLADALVSTSAFMELRDARAAVNRDANLKAALDSFEKMQAGLYSPELSDVKRRQLSGDLEAEYERLSAVPQINRFFRAAAGFNDYVSGMMDSVMTRVSQRVG